MPHWWTVLYRKRLILATTKWRGFRLSGRKEVEEETEDSRFYSCSFFNFYILLLQGYSLMLLSMCCIILVSGIPWRPVDTNRLALLVQVYYVFLLIGTGLNIIRSLRSDLNKSDCFCCASLITVRICTPWDPFWFL